MGPDLRLCRGFGFHSAHSLVVTGFGLPNNSLAADSLLPSILHPYCGSGEGIGLLRTPTVVLRVGADSPSHFPASSPLGQARQITLRSALKPRWDPA